MRHGNSSYVLRCTASRNGIKSAMLMVVIAMMGVMNVTQIIAQNQPSAEIFVDTSNINYPLRLTIATNTRKDIASMTIRASDPTKIVAFSGDASKVSLYPIGEVGMRISSIPDTAFLPTGSNLTIARFMTDNTTRQQKFTVDFLNRNGESVASQTLDVGIAAFVALAAPCNRNILDLTTGMGFNGQFLTPNSVDPTWVSVNGNIAGLPSGSNPVYVMPITNGWNYSNFSMWLGWAPGANGYYNTSWKAICINRDSTEVLFTIYCNADDSAQIFLVPPTGSPEILMGDATWWLPVPMPILYPTTLNTGTYYIRVTTKNPGGGPTGFRFDDRSNVKVVDGSARLGISGSNCCIAKGRLFGWKYWDKNCNGIKDKGDSPLSGWVITATPTAGGTPVTATTDGSGFYSMSLFEGTYTVSETMQSGWTPSTSSGPYTVNIYSNQSTSRDFLNCKQPSCEELFTELKSDSACCTGRFSISNAGNVVVTALSFSVTDGVLTGVNTSCLAATSPNLTAGLSTGTFTYIPGCPYMDVEFGAKSTTATGKICVVWTATFQQGTKTFKCSKEICLNCIRMPKDCKIPMQVIPDLYPPINTVSRTFTINNVKLPASKISSVDVLFVNEPTPPHIGGGLIVDLPPPRNWTYANSSAYNKIKLNCSGMVTPTFPQGAAASNWVKFNLGVDNTINYSGLILIKIGYCDGDTCLTEYQWDGDKINSIPSSIDTAIAIKNPRIFRFKVTSPDSTRSIGIKVGDSSVAIQAVTAPCGSLENDCPDITKQFRAATKGNIAHLTFGDGSCDPDPTCYCCPPDQFTLTVVYTPGTDKVDPKVPIKLSFFDKNAVEIGQAEKMLTSSAVSSVNSMLAPIPVGDVTINSVTPNPASGTVTFNYTLGTSETVRLELFNPLGQSVAVISEGFQTQGTHQLNYNVSTLESGTYYLRLTTLLGKTSAAVKVIH